MNKDRRLEARQVREDAAEKAYLREHPKHEANGDEQKFANVNYAMSFTKGLDHDPTTGLVKRPEDFEAFRQAIDNGVIEPFTTRVPVPGIAECRDRRRWEAPTAGIVFDLEGPDAQAVTMPPAPPLCSDELTFEMAEVYELALLRDVHFSSFDKEGKDGSEDIGQNIDRLEELAYAQDGFPGRPRITNSQGELDEQTVFRGSSPGVECGPYLSQFLLIGNADQAAATTPQEGKIVYGAQTIDQRVLKAEEKDDYMVSRPNWFDVQQGFDVGSPGQNFASKSRRFITTPRDLATYVHFDALYQAYLNACLILLGNGTPFDPSFDNLSGSGDHRVLINAATDMSIKSNTGGFALFGGPHILTLVTEVATRALKAVRYQKFNNHIRLRPEALAGRLEYADEIEEKYPELCACICNDNEHKKEINGPFSGMRLDLADTVGEINQHNNSLGSNTILLPMAFAEGSPMHPAYGAGHATVAGACVTVLKAFLDTSAIFGKLNGVAGFYSRNQLRPRALKQCPTTKGDHKKFTPVAYRPSKDGCELDCCPVDCPLTLEGELNKLAANISIGRNMAGVHYYSDYFDSVRMGEEIAIGILEEQALGYPQDTFVMSVPTFDGDTVRIGRR